ncbi:acyl-coenzyme A thioesterase 1-like [Polypterus senegalus]|nr:acyl-coenzyme A thioesterase 1-like [Polypterus senegalus]
MVLLQRTPRWSLMAIRNARWSSSLSARFLVRPDLCSLFSDPLAVEVEGLVPEQEVVVEARLRDEKGELFESNARYRADSSGRVDLSRASCLGGSYIGAEPMGLFWSLLPQNPYKMLVKRDVRSPFLVELEARDGEEQNGHLLARETLERGFLAKGVRRLPVKEGRVRGTLFLPPGEGPFPGVLDMYGTGGGLPEYRACLLSGHGFAVLALAYYGYQDLPKDMRKLQLEYFEEASAFLRAHPKVTGPGIGVIGASKSGDLALLLATFTPGISAVVSINGCNAVTIFPIMYKGTVFPGLIGDSSKITVTKSGIADIRDTLSNPLEGENQKSLIPIERADCRFLFLVSEDDRNWNSPFFAEEAVKRLKAHGKDNFEKVVYPMAGHYLEPPYFPHCPSSFHMLVGKPVVWGGEAKSHAMAQIDMWEKIKAFFKEHLGTGKCSSAKL